jgi:hypothetical protein
MPGWFKLALTLTTVVMVFSGLKVAKDKGIIKEEEKPQ